MHENMRGWLKGKCRIFASYRMENLWCPVLRRGSLGVEAQYSLEPQENTLWLLGEQALQVKDSQEIEPNCGCSLIFKPHGLSAAGLSKTVSNTLSCTLEVLVEDLMCHRDGLDSLHHSVALIINRE